MMDELAGPVLYSVIKADMRQKVVGLGTDDIDESHTDELLSVKLSYIQPIKY